MYPKFRRLYIIFILSVLILIGGGQLLIQYHISALAQMQNQSDWESGLIALRYLEYGIASVMLTLLMAEMFFLFRPAIRTMRFYKKKVTLINQELQASNTQLLLGKTKLKRYVKELRKQETALKLAKQKAENASQKKGQFLATMTHEIRTPLHAVTGIAHLLLRENPKPEQLEYLEMLRFSADNLMVLINDILDFNKIEAGKIELEETTFNLTDLIQGIQQSLTYKAKEKGIKLDLAIEGDIPPYLIGDPARVSQVLNNLVGNAIKFTEKGGVSIRVAVIEKNEKFINLGFEVADSGIGIPKDKLHSIFDSFTQAALDTTRKFGGSGLGLTITKELLRLMGSEITVNSEKGEGTVFGFNLQLEKGEIPKNEVEPPLQIEQLKSYKRSIRLLLVEDNEINRAIAGKILRNWDIEIEYAENGLVALEKLKNKQYDIILMDLQMPQMDGFETANYIRSQDDVYYQSLPIIALTASATTEAKNRVRDCGMDGFITKPFKPDELFETIVSHLDIDLEVQENITEQYHLKDKIEQFCEGDQGFRRQLTELYIQAFHELKYEYKEALEQKDAKKISFVIHKHATTITLLELPHLLSEMERGRKLINTHSVDNKNIHASTARVISMCDGLLAELNASVDLV